MARPYDFFPIQTFKSIPDPTPADANKALVVNNDGSNLVYTPVPGRKNLIINGNFDIWQRGTSFTIPTYCADRWVTNPGGNTTNTCSRQSFTVGETSVPGQPRYRAQNVVVSGGTSTDYCNFIQKIEGVRTGSGQTVTLTFWSNVTPTKRISVEFVQNFGTGGTPSATVFGIGVHKTAPATGFWTKHTITTDIPSIFGKTLGTNGNDCLQINFWFDAGSVYDTRTDTLRQQTGTFNIAQVQLEIGSEATAFEQRSEGEELALCQRYYWESHSTIYGAMYGTTSSMLTAFFPVTMRVVPSISQIVGTDTGTVGSTYATKDKVQTTISGDVSVYWYGGDIRADAEL